MIKNFEVDAGIIWAELSWIWIISHNNSTIPLAKEKVRHISHGFHDPDSYLILKIKKL